MANPSVTNIFVNGSVADASAVNQNFSDLVNSLTDGTKSLNVDAVTAAGTATLNGNVVLGNASGDTITANGTFGAISATGNISFDGGTFTFNASNADRDFKIEGVSDENLFVCDASTSRIGIGTNAPATQLHLSGGADGIIRLDGSATSGIQFYEGGARQFDIGIDGATWYLQDADQSKYVYVAQNFTAWTFASDRRMKENIRDIDSGLDTILAVTPRKFNFIGDENEVSGFIAQELREVLPEAVTGNEQPYEEGDSNTDKRRKSLGVSSTTLIPYLVKAIQEQQKIIESLQIKIDQLITG